ncbi:MAG TPA: lysine 2,3-aminomutase [Thermodesulfobacteriota bacterium]|nr:lysine 2,3-aminomutase [Thermodesulfobacteriota bacterium]
MSVSGSTVLPREPIRSIRLAEAKIPVEEEYQPNPWKDATDEEWEDWRWQLRNRITKAEQLRLLLNLNDEEVAAMDASKGRMATAITPYFATLMSRTDPNCPIRRQALPTLQEIHFSPHDLLDPCAEDENSPVHGLVHRYPDRVLLLVTDKCAVYCRYCTRRRMVGSSEKCITEEEMDEAINYIQATKKVRDVLISGGDPLLLEDDHLERILTKLRKIPHVEIVRIGTRVPVTLPQRITPALTNMLRKYHPLWMSIHFSHPKEITKEVRRSCGLLSDAGIPLGSQTVLLRGINDKPSIMKRLMHELLKTRVRPYYIYQCDLAMGTEHFRTPIAVGINIIEKLRGHTTGYAVPSFVIDAPGGGGKIPVGPTYLISQDKGRMVLRNYQGKVFEYQEPGDEDS